MSKKPAVCRLCKEPLPNHYMLCPGAVSPQSVPSTSYVDREKWPGSPYRAGKETLQDAYEKVDDSYRSWRGL